MDSLCQIVCGDPLNGSEASAVLRRIRQSVSSFGSRAELLLETDQHPDLTLIGPFCARVLMETGCAAVVGRLDPFRILYLSRYQSRAGYDPSKRAKSAFGWQGDVFTPDKEKDELWSDNADIQKISRALFSVHLDQIHWRPAVLAALDCAASIDKNRVVVEFLATDADDFIHQAKGRGSTLYSHLSKGVHWEFFADMNVSFDDR